METQRMCSRCGENPATEKHQWCNPCKARYQKEYTLVKAQLSEAQAFARGAEAMQSALLKSLRNVPPTGELIAMGVAEWIRNHPRPNYAPAPMPVNGE